MNVLNKYNNLRAFPKAIDNKFLCKIIKIEKLPFKPYRFYRVSFPHPSLSVYSFLTSDATYLR